MLLSSAIISMNPDCLFFSAPLYYLRVFDPFPAKGGYHGHKLVVNLTQGLGDYRNQ